MSALQMPAAGESAVALDLQAPTVIIRPMLTTDRAIDLFLGAIARSGYSDRTRTSYSRILDKFCDHLPIDLDVSKVTPDDCRRFLDGYNRRAPGTRAHIFSVLSSFFKWLYGTEKIARNPLERVERPKRIASSDLDVVTVSPDDVNRLMLHAESWSEKLAIGVLVYMGPRRRAVSRLRLTDWNRSTGHLRFREKGAKVIWKPVPTELDWLLEAALAAGAIEDGRKFLVPEARTESPYLIPPEGRLQKRDRDDRVIWQIVKRVGDRAGVETHVHALRAAFACFYLEGHPGDTEALKELMGHRSLATTETYLRKLDKQTAMERVRGLSWGVSMAGNPDAPTAPQIAKKALASSRLVGAGGFEPPNHESPLPERDAGQQDDEGPAAGCVVPDGAA